MWVFVAFLREDKSHDFCASHRSLRALNDLGFFSSAEGIVYVPQMTETLGEIVRLD